MRQSACFTWWGGRAIQEAPSKVLERVLLNTDYDMAAPRQWKTKTWEIGLCQATRINTKCRRWVYLSCLVVWLARGT